MKKKTATIVKVLEPTGIKVKVSQPHSMVCIIEAFIKSVNDEFKFLLVSDLHFDHPKCNRELLKEHFDECIRKGGYILINGDFFCVMQGKYDKRHNKASVRPENMVDNYFDSVVDDAAEFLLPYAKHILFIGFGNHETSIFKRIEIDILRRLTDRVYLLSGHRIALGEYHGWIYVKGIVNYGKTKIGNSNSLSYTIYHNHGTGGEAPVTGGSIEDNRKMTHIEGMDAIWMGHNHNKYAKHVAIHYLDKNPNSFKPKMKIIEVIRSGTYKQEYTGHGFHIETNKSPKPLGGIWLDLRYREIRNPEGQRRFLAPSLTPTWHDVIELDSV